MYPVRPPAASRPCTVHLSLSSCLGCTQCAVPTALCTGRCCWAAPPQTHLLVGWEAWPHLLPPARPQGHQLHCCCCGRPHRSQAAPHHHLLQQQLLVLPLQQPLASRLQQGWTLLLLLLLQGLAGRVCWRR
jgi:hypothetical protein